MAYLNTHARTSGPTKNDSFQPTGRVPALFGVFMGYVKDTSDIQRNGRLKVWIPEFGSAPEDQDGWVLANYCSPFAGATNVESANKGDRESFEGTQTSYGMWMIPPDINNQVLIMFINGDSSRAIWIGCLYNQYMNNMVPAMASSAKNWQHPGKIIPVAEYNKWDKSVTRPDMAIRPYEKTKFQGVGNQGLINDQARGITNSSARREAPSEVFGILTPGPVINKTEADKDKSLIRRKGGSSFIMDDGTGTEYIELATKSGAKIRLDETNGFVYIINRDGTAWMQMDQRGHVDVFSQFDISLRAQRDVNIRADRDVNLEAGQNFYISAAKDTITNSSLDITYDINNVPKKFDIPYYKKCPRGFGYGGNIVFTAEWDIHSTVIQHNYYNTTLGQLRDCSSNSPSSCQSGVPDGSQHYWSENNVHMSTNKNFHFWAHCSPPDPKLCLAPNVSGSFYLKSENIFNLDVLKVEPCKGGQIRIKCDDTYSLTSDRDQFRTIRKSGDYHFNRVDARGAILQQGPVFFNKTLDVVEYTKTGELRTPKINATVANIDTTYTSVSRGGGRGEPGTPAGIGIPLLPQPPVDATQAEQKGLNVAGNILPPIKEPFFKRGMEGWPTIVTRWPTYEPCPLHETFRFSSVEGYEPELNERDRTYQGSSSGQTQPSPPAPPDTTPGSQNQTLPPNSPSDSIIGKDFNLKAFECQIKVHEGVKNTVYLDTVGKPTAGIGHLLRANEIDKFPVGSKVSDEQVSRWFEADCQTAIKDAQRFVGVDTWEKLDEPRKRALVDMSYQLGGPNLSKFVNFRKALQAGDYDQAAKQYENAKIFRQSGRRGPAIASQLRSGTDLYGCGAKNPQQ